MSNSFEETRVRFPRRSTQGVVFGLDHWSVGTLVIAIIFAFLVTQRQGVGGLLASAIVWAPLAVGAVLKVHEVPLPKQAVIWLMLQLRRATGGASHRFRPEAPLLVARLNLPGRWGDIEVWEGNDIAVIYDPRKGHFTVTAELEVQGFLMKDDPELAQLKNSYSRHLAGMTKRGGVVRVVSQERTAPGSIQRARDFYRETQRMKGVDTASRASLNYEEVQDKSEQFAVSHVNLLSVTFSVRRLRKQINSFGGGKAGVLAVAGIEVDNLTQGLAAAGCPVRIWLDERRWAALGRTIFDPDYMDTVQSRPSENAGVSLAAIGPMALDLPNRNNRAVRTDSGWHQTLWVHEWPRTETSIGFLEPVVFARTLDGEAIRHIFSVVMYPVSTSAALRRIKKEKNVWRSNETMRRKRHGGDTTEADRADWDALVEQEAAIIRGEGEFQFGGYITVSARTEDELSKASASMMLALNNAVVEAQILYAQQDEALLVNTLPIGRGLD